MGGDVRLTRVKYNHLPILSGKTFFAPKYTKQRTTALFCKINAYETDLYFSDIIHYYDGGMYGTGLPAVPVEKVLQPVS